MKLSALLQDLIPAGKTVPDQEITGLSLSSQTILPQHLFVALGKGREYIPDAIQRGAHAILYENALSPTAIPGIGMDVAIDALSPTVIPGIGFDVASIDALLQSTTIPLIGIDALSQQLNTLADRFYGPFPALSTTGVTGTNGKTTVSYLLAQCLSALGSSCGLVGTLGTGFVGNLQFNGMTTPDVLSVHHIFSELQSQKAQTVAMEVSSHALTQKRVERVPFESALFTNLTQDHLDYHGTMEKYGNAKLGFFKFKSLQRAIINADDPFSQVILRTISPTLPILLCTLKRRSVFEYALHGNDKQGKDNAHANILSLTVEEMQLSSYGIKAKLETPFGSGELRSSLLGEFNVSNLLLVIGELLMRDYPLQDVLEVVAMAKPAPGRMQCFKAKNTAQVIIDYAHTPDALTRALQAARLHCQRNLWCVFGCGGDRDPGKRALMGANASQHADFIVITNDNPRTEDPRKLSMRLWKDVIT